MQKVVKPESLDWRDRRISNRHRAWGFNCPAVDIDFLLLEYDGGRPSALVEYKHQRCDIDAARKSSSIKALLALANGYGADGLPCMIVLYWPDTWAFRVYPLNAQARQFFTEAEGLTERAYVGRLYAIRRRRVEAEALANLATFLPDNEVA